MRDQAANHQWSQGIFTCKIESSKWGGQLTELTGAVSDGAVVHLTQESKVICDPLVMHSICMPFGWLSYISTYYYIGKINYTKKIEGICQEVITPNDSTANVLAMLFGSNKAGSGQKQRFDPSLDCIDDRNTIFASVIDLYSKGDTINKRPLQIKFASEVAIDAGGVTRELFSAFWEQAYQLLFEGATLLVPLLHPQSDMSLFPILGKIISHGYLSSGYLPVRIALPSLIGFLLGPNVSIPKQF